MIISNLAETVILADLDKLKFLGDIVNITGDRTALWTLHWKHMITYHC